MKLGDRLKELRNGCGFSQDYLASLLNMLQSNYCRIENNELSILNNKLEIDNSTNNQTLLQQLVQEKIIVLMNLGVLILTT